MKKVLVVIGIVASIVMVGCGDGGGADTAAAGKAAKPAEPAPVNAETGKSNGIADPSATPAPAGVKTGTPGG